MSLLITHPTCEIELSLSNNDTCTQVLACLDGYMNIALEQTEEYANGQVGNKKKRALDVLLNCNAKFSRNLYFVIGSKKPATPLAGVKSSNCLFLQLKNKYGDAFIRGNNVLYISTVRRR